ncbi:MAG: cytochrome b5 domain-containing protein [Candidatus Pacebacteria bacterium]|nr:cytochrome b5 domain-containing protein [Candidatus Paceibacterota bacterium]
MMVKIDRIAAWVLFAVVICYVITGYGMTKGFIDQKLSDSLHLGYLGAIGLIAFVIHTSWAAHLAMKRWNIWNKTTKCLLIAAYSSMILFFGYLHFFYQEGVIKNTAENESSIVESVGTLASSGTENGKVFNAETLKEYDGLNGRPAYVAVSGVVYDVSTLFVNGEHYGCKARRDVTDEFYSERRHRGGSVLDGYLIVGSYAE